MTTTHPDSADADADVMLAEFERTVERHDRIEPRDWMPEKYRATVVRQVAQHCPTRSCGGTRNAGTTTSASPTGTSS